MMDMLISAAHNPVTPIVVLVGIGVMVFVEAWKVSGQALMGDLYSDGFED